MTAAAGAVPSRPALISRRPIVLSLVGPTASGKTRIALAVAPGLRAEIVGIDSMQLYRGMDIGTAKPSTEERRRVPHHMIDVADPAGPYSVAAFQAGARSAIEGILGRGRNALLVGGSGLYYRAVVDDLEFPPTNRPTRSALEKLPGDVLAERLAAGDPEAAARIEPANVRRIVRALEVMELTGRPFSEFRRAWDRYESRYELVAAGVRLDAEKLAARVQARVEAMIDAGLVAEVEALLAHGFRESLTASRAIAYPEIVALLDGTITLAEARERIVRNTRAYARRQMAWFRADPRIRWFDGDDTRRAESEIRAYYDEEIARRGSGAS